VTLFSRKNLKIFFVALLVLEGVASLLLSGRKLRYPDERQYLKLAERMHDGQGYVNDRGEPTAQWPPGYPFFLSLVFRISRDPIALKTANLLLLALIIGLLPKFDLTRAVWDGVLTNGQIALYPLFFYCACTLYPQILGSLILIFFLYLLTNRPPSGAAAFAAGAVLGAGGLVIPYFLMLLPICLIWLYWQEKGPIFRRALRPALLVAGMLVALAPWTARNWAHFRTFVPVSTNGGINLLRGNYATVGPNNGVTSDIERSVRPDSLASETQRDAFYRRESLRWIRENKARALRLYFGKVANYFQFRNVLRVSSEDTFMRRTFLFVTYYPLLIVSLVRLLFRRRFPMDRTEGLFYWVYFGNAFVSAVFFTRIRFRVPFDFLLVAMVSTFLGRVLAEHRGKSAFSRKAAAAVSGPAPR
jgi:hypothetical protein